MKNLSEALKHVYNTSNIDDKKKLVLDMIQESSARTKTKSSAVTRVRQLSKAADVDRFATNYTLSGEGMKVF